MTKLFLPMVLRITCIIYEFCLPFILIVCFSCSGIVLHIKNDFTFVLVMVVFSNHELCFILSGMLAWEGAFWLNHMFQRMELIHPILLLTIHFHKIQVNLSFAHSIPASYTELYTYCFFLRIHKWKLILLRTNVATCPAYFMEIQFLLRLR